MKIKLGYIIFVLMLPILSNIIHAQFINEQLTFNWAGYVDNSNQYTFNTINGSWIVQTALPTTGNTFSYQWIGIGGVNGNLLQIGTTSNYCYPLDEVNVNCAPYSAWYETFPNPNGLPNEIIPINGFVISQGDKINASISFNGMSGQWKLYINDKTENEVNTLNVDEDPGINILPFAHFGIGLFGSKYTNILNTNYATLSNSTSEPLGNFLYDSYFIQTYGLLGPPLPPYPDAIPIPYSLNSSDRSSFEVVQPNQQLPPISIPNPFATPNTINLEQNSILTDAGATGGSGYYSYQWLEFAPGSSTFSNASTACNSSTSVLTYYFCTTVSGNYVFKLKVTDNATLDTITSKRLKNGFNLEFKDV
jgi:hypothetical protein